MNEIAVDNNIVVPEENNTTLDSNITNSEETQQIDSLIESDNLAVTLDYYDRYYEDVLNHLENIETYQETLIDNQETMITKFDTFDTYFGVVIFFIALIFIYNFIRNMITVK